MPKRIQRKRTKGWRMPPNTVCVTRPGKFSNPFKLDSSLGMTPMFCITQFKLWLAGRLRKHPSHEMLMRRERLLLGLKELRGKNLACFCPLDQPCHADVLLEIANS